MLDLDWEHFGKKIHIFDLLKRLCLVLVVLHIKPNLGLFIVLGPRLLQHTCRLKKGETNKNTNYAMLTMKRVKTEDHA